MNRRMPRLRVLCPVVNVHQSTTSYFRDCCMQSLNRRSELICSFPFFLVIRGDKRRRNRFCVSTSNISVPTTTSKNLKQVKLDNRNWSDMKHILTYASIRRETWFDNLDIVTQIFYYFQIYRTNSHQIGSVSQVQTIMLLHFKNVKRC